MILVGEVSDAAAVVWGRCRADRMDVTVSNQDEVVWSAVVALSEAGDFTGRVAVSGLQPGTSYRAGASCPGGAVATAHFDTAPPPEVKAAVRFAWGGDVGGQNACRDATHGYPIFDVIRARRPHFFIGLGDMIYADDPCLLRGRYGNRQIPGPAPAHDLDQFRAHWRYNRSDRGLRQALASSAYFPVWDDHETVNDAGPGSRHSSGALLLPPARQAFIDYNPISLEGSWPAPLHRRVRWGQHLEIFLLDQRSYRDDNTRRDSATKTMLGTEQRRWLIEGLRGSTATWKFVVSTVPISVTTCRGPAGCDGWANGATETGFEQELRAILTELRAGAVRNLVWLTTDVHFAAGFRYRPFGDEFELTEYITGPLNAGIFPQSTFDPTFAPTRLFQYPQLSPAEITDYDQARRWFNFGLAEIGADGVLRIEIVNSRGETLYQESLPPIGRISAPQ